MMSIILLIGLVSRISAQPCVCPAIYQPVCCNGVGYSNKCFASCDETCADADISDGPCPQPGGVCGEPGVDCLAFKCACGLCPDGVSEFGCCSDCVFDDELTCQSISSCPNNCANTVCSKEDNEWCIEDLLAGPQCTSCAAISCRVGQECVFGVGCQDSEPTITCANVLCVEGSYCIYDEENGPRCIDPCECDTDDDCEDGFICNETPEGFEGCSSDVTDSCFGFCSAVEGTCGCDDAQLCLAGDCYALQETCSEAPTVCGSIENCAIFSDGCNTCDCGVDGSAEFPRCTEIACKPDQIVPYFCDTCADGYEFDDNGDCVESPPDITCANIDCLPGATCIEDPVAGPICVPIYSCGDIDYCTAYIENGCNTCICDANGLEACTEIACLPPQDIPNVCDTCVDGFTLSDDGSSCDFGGDCICTREFDPVCCNGYTYSNPCTARCAGCDDDQIQDGGCGAVPSTTTSSSLCPDNCLLYSDGCSNCVCNDDGDVTCTPDPRLCKEDPLTGERTICNPCDPRGPPYSCSICQDGYTLDKLLGGECVESTTTGCGGFENCASFFDGCNSCGCSDGSTTFCTLRFCEPDEFEESYCTSCIDGYTLNPLTGDCIELPTCAAILCPVGEKCIEDPANGGRCVDEDVCCPPLDPADVLTTCGFEGCACCPDGSWQGSIGDGDTFCGGLKKSEGDIFGEVCDDDDDGDLKKCTSNGINSECSRPYKCRPNPNCRNSGRCNPRRVCVDVVSGFCSDDSECDTANGYSCIGNRPNGKGYGKGNGNCIKFEDP